MGKLISKIKNNLLYQIITCIILCSIVIFVSYILYKKIDEINFRKYTLTDDIKLINTVEKMYISDNNLILEGYAFYLENDSNNSSISLFLKNLKNDDEIWMNTKTVSRPDVQNYYECEYNYENSGFIATTESKNINMDEGYEIIVNIDINDNNCTKYRKTVSTNRYIYKGKLLCYNPYTFEQPDENVKSELLKKVFNEGQLQFYQKDIGLYIYKYQNKLYWIATEDFQFNENGQTYIPYHLYTTQIYKLPENRVQYGFDNLDFIFEDCELIDEGLERYHVVIKDLPNSYSITYIETGVYDLTENKWLYNITFQLH